ncbi:MAG: response regulator [Planctomycetaceae bacterium]|nr:MAG: response regulator [Planctomycetaceae bacterium]
MTCSCKVLVIDDDPNLRSQMRTLLQADGFEVTTVASGLEALETVDGMMPDLVVSDVHMPAMNGVDLVVELKKRFPVMPIILTTGAPGDEIAAEGLRLGAATYVPKRELDEVLCETVHQVLELVKADQIAASDPAASLIRTELHFRIGTNESLVPRLISRMEQAAVELRFCDEMQWMQVAMALDEAIVNAIFHGNLEVSTDLRQIDDGKPFFDLVQIRKSRSPYRERQVDISMVATPDEATFVIRDEGHGFDVNSIPDPTDPANLEKAGGRGLLLIHSFMDEVRHNAKGNEITIVKRKTSPRAEGSDEEEDEDD